MMLKGTARDLCLICFLTDDGKSKREREITINRMLPHKWSCQMLSYNSHDDFWPLLENLLRNYFKHSSESQGAQKHVEFKQR